MDKPNPRTVKTILNNKRNDGSVIISDFKLYHEAILKSAYIGLAKMDKLINGMALKTINPHTYGYVVFDKEAKSTCWKKKPSSTNGNGQTGRIHWGECKFILTYHPPQNSTPNGSKISM